MRGATHYLHQGPPPARRQATCLHPAKASDLNGKGAGRHRGAGPARGNSKTASVQPSLCTRTRNVSDRRVRLGRLPLQPDRGAVERLDGTGVVEVEDRVELLREACQEVMAPALRLGPIDDADRPLEAPFRERVRDLAVAMQVEVEARVAHLAEERFPGVRERGPQTLAPGRTAPRRGGGDGAEARRQADEDRVGAAARAHELPEARL